MITEGNDKAATRTTKESLLLPKAGGIAHPTLKVMKGMILAIAIIKNTDI
jgi:hypothetical protein